MNSNILNKNKTYTKLSYKFQENLTSLDMKEIQALCNLSSEGKLYESLITSFNDCQVIEMKESYRDQNGVQHYIVDSENRKKLKRDFLSMIFARNKDFKEIQNLFGRQYPSVILFLRKMKRKYYKRLSHYLFQIESYIMLDVIAREFNLKKRGRTPIFTIHDSIVTTEDNIEELYEFTKNKLSSIFTNKQPQIKLQLWQKN